MPRDDHYGILLAINHYPGLRNLAGPENDVVAFARWLKDAGGGNLAPANVKIICSSDFDATTDPNDANPTERAFIKALDKWLRDDRRQWRERVGERLYLYMAGHGFTAGSSIADPALFSAVAQNGDTAHIAGFRYASKIANAGFFDEIVLVMDCCQDVLKSSQVIEPTWSPTDRNRSGQVKLLQIYGAPRGEAAFEREIEVHGQVRGYLSTVLIEALETALPDAQGYVTGQTLKNQMLQIWDDRYKTDTGYDPPIRTPDAGDIRLFPRSHSPAPSSKLHPVQFSLKSPAAGTTLDITIGSQAPVISMPTSALIPQTLPPGLYKASLSGTPRSVLFEVHGTAPLLVEL